MSGAAGAVGLAVACAAGAVAAEPWHGAAEAGVEYDSNVRRVEDQLGPAPAPMLRAKAAVDARGGSVRGLRWTVALSGGSRAAVAGAIASENAVTGALDTTVARRTSAQLGLTARATHYEVFPLTAELAARAFASSGADVGAVLGDDGRTVTVAVGARRLVYKPDPDFDWTGPALGVALAQPLWRGADERALDLTAGYRLERRGYRGLGYDNGCAPGVMLEVRCFVPGDRPRSDLVQIVSATVGYTGTRAVSLGYELTVDDSTSFGSSFVRHRLSAAVTAPVVARVFATATVTGQLERYADPQLVARDVASQTFASLDDEARSSAALRLGRGFGRRWQAELRWSYHLSALGDPAAAFHRQLVYLGVTWER
ncbi:MAG: hypothetical protein R3B06_13200 [Kofleriaceae bacterium]